MIDLKSINNNIIANRWKQRYAEQPDEIREKLDKLDEVGSAKYQLQVIKRKRIYPQIGDVFMVKPKEEITLYGVVINNHINNINGDDLLLVLILKNDVDIVECIKRRIVGKDLLIPPQLVGSEYWTRGYFYNVEHYDNKIDVEDYGFYSVGKGKIFDEYGNVIPKEPYILGTYGVATITGIARKVNQELIIEGIL